MPEITNPQLRGAVEHLITQVTPENVLDVRRVLLDEAFALREVITRYDVAGDYQPTGGADPAAGRPGSGFTVGLCSGDPISGPAAVSFNRKIAGIVSNCRAYVADLFTSCEHLAAVARTYGVTEDEIAESFRSAETRRDDVRRAETRAAQARL